MNDIIRDIINILAEGIAFIWPCVLVNACFNIFYMIKQHAGLLDYDVPLDLGITIRGTRLLGESTTFGGLLIALLVGAIGAALFPDAAFFIKAIIAYFGHALGSFIKRRAGYERGEYMPVVDHGDYVILAAIIFWAAGALSFFGGIAAIALVMIIQPIGSYAFWSIGIRDRKI